MCRTRFVFQLLKLTFLAALHIASGLPVQAQTETVLYSFTGGAGGKIPAGLRLLTETEISTG